ncbi:RNA-binding protein [Mycena sanguinolenta]|uniref:RNA-binding protein n=1 Tax=Mycena sanguinolenta TaxID=230812 RepID=A0A8H6X821_9AGAR|nr:RNA-binding protein [Mycena sanguinolenta]
MPLGIHNSAVHILRSPGTPHTPETQGLNGRLASVSENEVNAGDLQASLLRLESGQYNGGLSSFNSMQPGGLTLCRLNGLDGNGYSSYGFESGGCAGANSPGTNGSTAPYHHNGSRYGLGLPARTNSGAGDGKMTPKVLEQASTEDSQARYQFIYNTVAANYIEVATRRHGCCVLQPCIDLASHHQHIQLVNEITFNALTPIRQLRRSIDPRFERQPIQ